MANKTSLKFVQDVGRHLPMVECTALQRKRPAKEAVCHGCGKRGHYKSMCKSKPQSGHSSIRTVQVDSDVFLGTVHSDMAAISAEGIPWTTNVTQ